MNQLFTIRPALEWIESASELPRPRMIFDRFWLEGGLAISFGATGKCKTVLGMQIAESIARRRPIDPFRMKSGNRKIETCRTFFARVYEKESAMAKWGLALSNEVPR